SCAGRGSEASRLLEHISGHGAAESPAAAFRRRIRRLVAPAITPAAPLAILGRNRPSLDRPVIKSSFFVLRLAIAWMLGIALVASLWSNLPLIGWIEWPIVLAGMITMALVVAGALSHLGRVRLIAGRIDRSTL